MTLITAALTGNVQRTMKPPPVTRALTVRWPSDLHDRLRRTAERNDRTVNAEVRIAVREHLEREAAINERNAP